MATHILAEPGGVVKIDGLGAGLVARQHYDSLWLSFSVERTFMDNGRDAKSAAITLNRLALALSERDDVEKRQFYLALSELAGSVAWMHDRIDILSRQLAERETLAVERQFTDERPA